MPPPKKRRTGPGSVEHHGRTTKRTSQPTTPTPPDAMELPTVRPRTGSEAPLPSRYTPPSRKIRFRPGWHKAVGFALLLVGVALVALNDMMLLDFPATLLPGGHNEGYLFLGLAIVGYSTWWFGWFDRTR